ncbi:hypothetical protein HYU40_00250 [Candidatus Woesearchaeota archaeon]|nr:hypothetical protein [Candidatus Woesearchaeota archaeon]
MEKNLESRMVLLFVYALLALVVVAADAQAVPVPTAAPCFNGVQDADEKGVDCGGGCASAYAVEYCDGKDNDLDCAVDEDCKESVAHAKESAATCSDGIQNQGELAVDCAGECVISAKEVCDGLDNDRDCYVDEGGVCEVPSAQSLSGDLCVFPNRQIGYENNPDYFAVMEPSCVIEDDIGSLKYLSTLNLTKSLNANRAQKETLQSIVALYGIGEGRCSAVFTAYPDAAAAKQAAIGTASPFMPLRKSGSNYLYINDTEGIGYWVKGSYIVTVTSFDYISHHKWDEDCSELLGAYLAKIGSDLSPATKLAPGQQAGAGKTIAETGLPPLECTKTDDEDSESLCTQAYSKVGAGQVPDENGMVMSCDVNETGVVVCKKVKASELPPVVPDVESASGVNPAGTTAESEESQVAKIRRIAKEHNIYLSNYSDGQLLSALQKFSDKHKKELEEKYGNQEPSEDKMAEILKQFSQEEFAKELKAEQQASQQPQKQSFFTKVRSFFKRLF